MRLLSAILGTAGLLSMIFAFLILARLTQKWESVTKLKSHYRLFYVSTALVGIASLVRLIRIGYLDVGLERSPASALGDPRSWIYLCFYHAPLAIGVTISLGVTWRSWGWLLGGQGRTGSAHPPHV